MAGYYKSFPAKAMNVTIADNEAKKKIVVAEKDFEPGDVIYTVCTKSTLHNSV